MKTLALIFLCFIQLSKCSNILFFLCDDTDLILGGTDPLVKSRSWIADRGATFNNAFASTPLCCTSRATILTGRYMHNHNVVNITEEGGCHSQEWVDGLEATSTYAKLIHDTGLYKTSHSGKYDNSYHNESQIPPGWDDWNTKSNDIPFYYNYSISANGIRERHGDNYALDYSNDLYTNRTMDFLNTLNSSSQFLAVIGFDASHYDFIPAPQYANEFETIQAPRNPNFNYVEPQEFAKHWLVSGLHRPLNQSAIDRIDEMYRDRLRTMLSVDDAIDQIMSHLEARNMLDDTFVIFTSDHGYHFAEHGLPEAKLQLYESDIRIPLWISGPGIPPSQIVDELAVTIDLAPTFLDMAGVPIPDDMDGISLLPLLQFFQSTQRTSFLVEYKGMGNAPWNENPTECQEIYAGGGVMNCYERYGCHCIDSLNNTFSCVRTMSSSQNDIYCTFEDDLDFVEFYNLAQDPYQLFNLATSSDNDFKEHKEKLTELKICHGTNCLI